MDTTPYWVLVREMKDAYNHRLRLVTYARQHGLKPAPRSRGPRTCSCTCA